MLATSSPLILTPLTYLAGRLWGFLLCTTLLSAVLCCLCEVFYKCNPSSTVFCCYDPLLSFSVEFRSQSLQAWRVRWYRLFIFLLALLLLWRSCILNWVPLSNFHHVSLTRQRCDSQRQPPFHFFVGFEPTSSICILIFERASSVRPFFFFNRCYVNLFVNIILDREITVFIIARVWTLSILIFDLQCYPSFLGHRFHWSCLSVSQSFCISFSFVWWSEAFCVALHWIILSCSFVWVQVPDA